MEYESITNIHRKINLWGAPIVIMQKMKMATQAQVDMCSCMPRSNFMKLKETTNCDLILRISGVYRYSSLSMPSNMVHGILKQLGYMKKGNYTALMYDNILTIKLSKNQIFCRRS